LFTGWALHAMPDSRHFGEDRHRNFGWRAAADRQTDRPVQAIQFFQAEIKMLA